MNGDYCITTRCVTDPAHGDSMIETKVFQRKSGVITQVGGSIPEFYPEDLASEVMDRQHKVMLESLSGY